MTLACAAPAPALLPESAGQPSHAPVPSAGGWPRHWSQQELLLERQHDRLEALLHSLIQQHRQPLPWEQLLPTDQAEQLACRRLLWDLRLHLRLEERWLEAAGALCPGHRSGHQEVARAALAQFCRGGGSRRARLAWLQELHTWFAAHRRGPDAMAYALARQRSAAQAAAVA
jgi:hemerythrin